MPEQFGLALLAAVKTARGKKALTEYLMEDRNGS